MDDLEQGEVVSAGVKGGVELQIDETEHSPLMTTQCPHALATVKVPATHRPIVRTCRQQHRQLDATSIVTTVMDSNTLITPFTATIIVDLTL